MCYVNISILYESTFCYSNKVDSVEYSVSKKTSPLSSTKNFLNGASKNVQ